MPLGWCPECDAPVDVDGFSEHGVPTIWFCRCEKLFLHGPKFAELTELNPADVDMSENFVYGTCRPRIGEFIIALRWRSAREKAHKLINSLMITETQK